MVVGNRDPVSANELALSIAGLSAVIGAPASYAALSQSPSEQAIGWTGELGEDALQELGGQTQVYFRTSEGGRYVDQLVGGIANESKVGYTCLTKSTQLQIAENAELMVTGQVDAVVWHFFRSPVTGLAGPSQPLMEALVEEGMTVIVY